MARELRVDAEVAKLLPAAMIAQLQASIDDPDNVCCICMETISGPSAEVIVFTDGNSSLVKVAHSECATSSVQPLPGLHEAVGARLKANEGFAMATLLGVRNREPRALIFLEPEVMGGGPDEDPLELYATALGLLPVSGSIEDIDPGPSEEFTVERTAEGLALRGVHGVETVPAGELERWLEAAKGQAVVIVARGLGLSRAQPTIEEALALRPAWAAVAVVNQ